jgi:hypothetical protein
MPKERLRREEEARNAVITPIKTNVTLVNLHLDLSKLPSTPI